MMEMKVERVKTTGQTQDTLEGPHFPSSPGEPWWRQLGGGFALGFPQTETFEQQPLNETPERAVILRLQIRSCCTTTTV